MKSIIAVACAFLFASSVQTKTSNQLLKDLEAKLQKSLISKLDAQGIKQLQNLVQLTAFSQLTDLAKLSEQKLKQFITELPDYKQPDVDMAEYEAEVKRIDGC